MIRTALIGTTGYAALYLEQLQRLALVGAVELVAIVVIHQREHANEVEKLEKMGLQVFSMAQEMFDMYKGQIDLCCIPTSIDSHEGLTKMALNAGCNVLVEKPVAGTLDAISALQKLAFECEKKVFVGYQNLAENATWKIKESLLQGEIGTIKSAHLLGLWPRAMSYFKRNNWAGKVKTEQGYVFDSVLHNAFAHFLNLMLFWTSDKLETCAEPIDVKGQIWQSNDIETFDSCSLEIITNQEIPLYVNLSHCIDQNVDPKIRIEGSNGTLEWFGDYYVINNDVIRLSNDNISSINEARQTMFDNVIANLNGVDKPIADLSLSQGPTKTVNLIHENLTVSNSSFHSIASDYGQQRVIIGLGKAMETAYTKGGLVSENFTPRG